MTRVAVNVNPNLLKWALGRARLPEDDPLKQDPKINDWLLGKTQPTMKQLERFAKKTHTAIGYFFLPEPPVETLPVHDFRRMAHAQSDQPSPNLLDTLYLCQQRQEWYRDYHRLHKEKPLAFVRTAKLTDNVVETAAAMRQTLGFNLEERRQYSIRIEEALRRFIGQVEALGVLVMVSGVVGSNARRKLDPEEFRGFALVDELAPLIFINGRDCKAAQMFTLAHELAHIWLGEGGVSNGQALELPDEQTERWCNAVAAELLVPLEAIREQYQTNAFLQDDWENEARKLRQQFKVSTLVLLRRLCDADVIDKKTFLEKYDKEQTRYFKSERRGSGGGNFYNTLDARVGKRFIRALVSSTLEGQTLFRDAFRMLGIRKTETFYNEAERLGLR